MKQWLLLGVPLLLVVAVFIFSAEVKDPKQIITNAELNFKALDDYSVKSVIVMDINMMGGVMRYVSNITTAFVGGQYYNLVKTAAPFSDEVIVVEQFVIKEGNYSCTNEFSKNICYVDPELVFDFDEGFGDIDYNSIVYVGSKKVSGFPCDVISFDSNLSETKGMFDDSLGPDEMAEIKEMFMLACVDPVTGLTLESAWGVNGESSYAGLLVDTGINVTKFVESISHEVPETFFILPYEVVSEEEYAWLVNESYAGLFVDESMFV